ncbi:MAG: cytochrome-c oxidase, cbb3-type subunit III [Pseudomonadota bacterium]
MAENIRTDEATGTQTVGHEWDGIEELNTPLPRWWLWTFYATVFWSIVYVILYPAWPLVNSATAGVLGWSSRGDVEQQLAAREAELAPIHEALVAADINSLVANAELRNTAIQGGQSAYKVHCVQCHGADAAGLGGYPNLNDDDWLWGGDLEAIEYTLIHGIRNPDHPETRFSQMPAFGADGLLNDAEIGDVASYVRLLSGEEQASAASQRGATLFANNCAVCHGGDGKGNRELGAPNLTDAISLYGTDREALTETIYYSRNGVMPRWGQRLDPATIRMLAVYVHSLGGGEVAPAAAEDQAPDAAETASAVPPDDGKAGDASS